MAISKKDNETKMFSLVEQWQKVGGNKIKFCKEHNINKSGFYYWLNKYNDKYSVGIPKPVSESFSKISTPKKKANPLKVTYPNGVTINVSYTDLETLSTLIKLWD